MSCTSGYDNDGSTGLEIFQNGVSFGRGLDKDDKVFVYDRDHTAFFFSYQDEEQLKKSLHEIEEWG
jgi:hypothetical protein